MNKHEIEALREIEKKLCTLACKYYLKNTIQVKSAIVGDEIEEIVIDLQDFLGSLPAPADDGLREGARGLIAQWREHLRRREDDGLSNKRVLIGDCADMLEDLLAKTPDGWKPIADAPRDGLEELPEIIKGWKLAAESIKEKGNKDFAEGLERAASDLQIFLDCSPNPWKPIADAPRDGTYVELCRWTKQTQLNKFVIIVGYFSRGRWKDFKMREIPRDWATHFKPLPAPPREGKECES